MNKKDDESYEVFQEMGATNTHRESRNLLYSQLCGLGSRRSLCAWTEGGDAGVVGGGTGNAADSHG